MNIDSIMAYPLDDCIIIYDDKLKELGRSRFVAIKKEVDTIISEDFPKFVEKYYVDYSGKNFCIYF